METNIENTRIEYPARQMIRVYNHFPRRYTFNDVSSNTAVELMINDLSRIAKMHFNVVWINPVQFTGDYIKTYRNKKVSGSLYAMADDKKLNPDLGLDENGDELLRKYVAKAKEYGLTPIFDLVLHHIGLGISPTPLQQRLKPYLGKPDFKKWQDTIPLDYSTENNMSILFEKFWEPYIKKYIVEYGFLGVRLDAVSNLADINPKIIERASQLVREFCRKHHRIEPIIMGELMVKDPTQYISKLKPAALTHVFLAGAFYNNFYNEGMPFWLKVQAECKPPKLSPVIK